VEGAQKDIAAVEDIDLMGVYEFNSNYLHLVLIWQVAVIKLLLILSSHIIKYL